MVIIIFVIAQLNNTNLIGSIKNDLIIVDSKIEDINTGIQEHNLIYQVQNWVLYHKVL
jgi:hypothetical protein